MHSGLAYMGHSAPNCPGLAVPARHVKKSQNLGIDENIGVEEKIADL
jgi:hypothetical protein